MKFLRASRKAVAVLLAGLWLSGCSPFFDEGAEEKNPLIADAHAKRAAYNYEGAVESLEKALEANPRLALAHWELGLVYCQNLNDYAAAIYHFERLLKLRPDWRQADTARQLINVCKIELAKSVPLGPLTPQAQRQLDQLTTKVHELTGLAGKLQQQNEALQSTINQLTAENLQLTQRLRALATAPAPGASSVGGSAAGGPPLSAPTVTNLPPQGSGSRGAGVGVTASPGGAQAGPAGTSTRSASGRGASPSASGSPPSTSPSPARPRTYTIRAGDRVGAIAARHGVKIKDIVALNPNLNPERIKPGQVIRLP